MIIMRAVPGEHFAYGVFPKQDESQQGFLLINLPVTQKGWRPVGVRLFYILFIGVPMQNDAED